MVICSWAGIIIICIVYMWVLVYVCVWGGGMWMGGGVIECDCLYFMGCL